MSAPGKARALACLSLAELLAMTLWFSASAAVPQLAEAWDLGPAGKAWVTAAVQLGFVVGALASAATSLPDRVPNHVLFAACALAGAGATAAIPAFDVGATGGIALRFATGVFLAGVYPPGMRLAATWSLRDRGLAIGLLVGALTLGSAVPHLMHALPIFGDAGMPPWRAMLYASATLATISAVLVAATVREGPHLARAAAFDMHQVRRVLASRPLRLVNLGYLGHMWELYAMWTWIPLLLIDSYASAGKEASSARLAGFAVVAAGAPACVLAGWLADRIGRTAVAGGSLAVSGSCCVLAGLLLERPAALTVLCILWGFAVVADSAQFSAAASELADADSVGTALTLQTCLGFSLTMVSIHLVTALADRIGWALGLASLALGPVVGCVALLRLRRLPEALRLASGRR